MTIANIRKNEKFIGAALCIVSVSLASLIAVKVAGFCDIPADAGSTVDRAIDRMRPNDNIVKTELDKTRIIADTLKKQNLFSPPAPKKNPVTAVLGIFGHEALINGKWYKAGDMIGDAKIVSVESTAVTVQWKGSQKVFNPIDGVASTSQAISSSGSSRTRSVSSTNGGAQMVIINSTMPTVTYSKPEKKDNKQNKNDKTKNTYDSFSKGQKEKFKKAWQKLKDQTRKMPDSERAKLKTRLIEKIGRSK